MTRLIDADALAEQYTEMVERLLLIRGSIVPSHVTTLIINAPTIDAVEVVRCKDCKYHHKHSWYNTCDKIAGSGFPDDWYCADGERKQP